VWKVVSNNPSDRLVSVCLSVCRWRSLSLAQRLPSRRPPTFRFAISTSTPPSRSLAPSPSFRVWQPRSSQVETRSVFVACKLHPAAHRRRRRPRHRLSLARLHCHFDNNTTPASRLLHRAPATPAFSLSFSPPQTVRQFPVQSLTCL
jgi:hypothetical protein